MSVIIQRSSNGSVFEVVDSCRICLGHESHSEICELLVMSGKALGLNCSHAAE